MHFGSSYGQIGFFKISWWRAFDELKKWFTKEPVLMMPDQTKPFQIETDASKYATGAVLTQLDANGDRHPVSWGFPRYGTVTVNSPQSTLHTHTRAQHTQFFLSTLNFFWHTVIFFVHTPIIHSHSALPFIVGWQRFSHYLVQQCYGFVFLF